MLVLKTWVIAVKNCVVSSFDFKKFLLVSGLNVALLKFCYKIRRICSLRMISEGSFRTLYKKS